MINILRHLRSLSRSERGNVALLSALAMPVVLGSLGLGAEVASWYGGKRSLQNAADSAAIAAATNASASYADEARAVAARYGFQQGVDGVSVTATNTAPCPGGGTNDCYRVTITRPQPLMLAQVVGVQGDVQLNGAPAKVLAAAALAMKTNTPREYCVTALAGSGATLGIDGNGSPDGNIPGCNLMSNTDATCSGHDLNADWGDAHGVNTTCGNRRTSHVPAVSDTYESLKSNIPSDPCSSYAAAPTRKKDPPLPSSNMLHGLESRSVIEMCGDAELSGPVIINSGTNTVLYVRNGSLNLKSYKLETMAGSNLTIVFTGSDITRNHIPMGNGAFDFAAPTTGPWKGMAIYQDPRMTQGVDLHEAGNAPTWNLTGMVYVPHSAVTFSGVVNKASNGSSCFGIVMDHMRLNGTAEILAHGECPAAGLVLPQSLQPGRGQLVG